jgi:hypothetical protein
MHKLIKQGPGWHAIEGGLSLQVVASLALPKTAMGLQLAWDVDYQAPEFLLLKEWRDVVGFSSIALFLRQLPLPPDSNFIQFGVASVRCGSNSSSWVSLTQKFVPFQREGVCIDIIPGNKALRCPGRLVSGVSPRWFSRANASWPLLEGRPMDFVGDYDVPIDSRYSELSGCGRCMLFVDVVGDPEFAVMNYDTSGQSIEQHYADEARRNRSARRRRGS